MPQQRRASQTVELNDDEAARLQTLVRTAIDHLEARLATGDDPSHAQAYLDRALLRSMTRQLSGLEPDPCEPPRAAAALAAANDQAAHRMAALRRRQLGGRPGRQRHRRGADAAAPHRRPGACRHRRPA